MFSISFIREGVAKVIFIYLIIYFKMLIWINYLE